MDRHNKAPSQPANNTGGTGGLHDSPLEEPVSSEPVSEPRRRGRRPGNRANAWRGWGSYKKFGINPMHC
jgi:hypothetical protein